MTQIIVTLTTIPERFTGTHSETPQGMITNIQSLLNQDFDGDYEIHLNIPDVMRYTGKVYEIPEWLLELERDNPTKLKLFRGVEDLGPITKLFHTVARVTDPETIIIVCDDDLVYHPKMIEEHVKSQETYVDTVCGYDGCRMEDPFSLTDPPDVRTNFVVSVFKDVYVNFLQHYKTISYRRRFFGEDFEEFVREFINPETYAGWNDDILVGAYVKKRGLQSMVRWYEHEEQLYTIEQWNEKGGVLTFPVVRDIARGGQDGCFMYRRDDKDTQYNEFLKRGYLK